MVTQQSNRPSIERRPRKMAARRELTLAEHACLAAVDQGVNHGWGIGSLLAPDGEIGRIWTLTRPLTYRAIDSLVDRRLLTRRGTQTGQGRERTILHITAAGGRAVQHWLDEPVEHLRDVRTTLLVKLAYRERAGLDVAPLLAAQQALFAGMIDDLTTVGPHGDLVHLWRRENARAVRRFLDEALHPDRIPTTKKVRTKMRLSARNQLKGTITSVIHGEVMSTVAVTLPDGQEVTAAITKSSATDLDLATGDDVVVIIKSTEVMIGKPD